MIDGRAAPRRRLKTRIFSSFGAIGVAGFLIALVLALTISRIYADFQRLTLISEQVEVGGEVALQMVELQRLSGEFVESGRAFPADQAGIVFERAQDLLERLDEKASAAVGDRVERMGTHLDGFREAMDSGGREAWIDFWNRGDVRAAVEEHTTSKISDIDDLEGGVATLGFRGEALHAIGAVSRTTVTSKPRGGDRGAKIHVDGGDVGDVEPAGCPEGTTVEVTDLFYNVPARRKYLSQESTEFAHVNTVVTNYALANPDVAVSLTHDGRETFA
ncbi:MAG: hypothetical protein ACOC02_04470, partial [Guyparkeria sp.]